MRPGPTDHDDAVFAGLRVRFVEGFAERLNTMDTALARTSEPSGNAAEAMECIRSEAHKLRGAGATFGFSAISEIAGRLEDHLDSLDQDTEPDTLEIRNFIDRLRTELELAEQ